MGKIITLQRIPGTVFDNSHIDYSKANALTEEQIEAAAKSDPDAQPLTEEDIKMLKIRRPNQPRSPDQPQNRDKENLDNE